MRTGEKEKIKFTLSDIKFRVDKAMFERARKLALDGKVNEVQEHRNDYSAVVRGGSPYQVIVSKRNFDRGDCTCYMGRHDQLCKHMIALALEMLRQNAMTDEKYLHDLSISFKSLTPKRSIQRGISKLKPYEGPSSIWFYYQDELREGVDLILAGVENIPHTISSMKYLFKVAQKINEKLLNGVDDSDGTVWPVIEEILSIIIHYAESLEGKKATKMDALIKEWAKWDSGFDFERYFINYLERKRERGGKK